jgi:PD-(D/E)XK nuclease superfamily
MSWKHYATLRIKSNEQVQLKPRFSLTNDIVGFRRCARQYGFFNIRGYIPAHSIQLFYGAIIHEVLDRAHQHYKGLEDPQLKGTMPTDEDIEKYFFEVENRLRAQGIKAFSRDLRDKAVRLLKKFNKIEGPVLYPRVIDTEHRLQGNRESYIVEGVIDVLVDSHTGKNNTASSPSDITGVNSGSFEIWDYKGTKFPSKGNDRDLINYRYQMLVYAALYKLRNGTYPKRAVLYFLNELDKPGVNRRPQHALYSVEIADTDINKALKEFDETAESIQKSKETNRWDPPSPDKLPLIEDTCAICDIRWSCLSFIQVKNPSIAYP